MTRQLDVDEILRSWLAEGVERAPEPQVSAALDEIDRTPQRRPLLTWLPGRGDVGRVPHRQSLAFAAIGILALAIGIGVGVRTGVIRLTPTPVPVPSAVLDPGPSASDHAEPEAAVETFTAPDGTFEIQLPESWDVDAGPDASALYLVGQPLRLSIRAGDADGSLLTCDEGAGPWETCSTYRDLTGTLDSLAAAIGLTAAPEEGIAPIGPTRSETTLDGETARVEKIEAYEYPARGAEFVTYVVAMHDGRPFVLRAWSPGSASIDILDIIAGFSFLEPEAIASPSPSPSPTPDELETFRAPDGTFEIRLPVRWNPAVAGSDPTALYLRNGRMELTIRAGDADGGLLTCDLPAGPWESCDLTRPSSLEELAAAVGLDDDGLVWQGPLTAEAELGGEPGAMLWIVGQVETSNFAQAVTVKYVVAMHGNRPFIVRIRGSGEGVNASELLASFRFIDD